MIKRAKGGFSLIEVVLVMGLMAATFAFAIQILKTVQQNQNDLRRYLEIIEVENTLIKLINQNKIECQDIFESIFLSGAASTAIKNRIGYQDNQAFPIPQITWKMGNNSKEFIRSGSVGNPGTRLMTLVVKNILFKSTSPTRKIGNLNLLSTGAPERYYANNSLKNDIQVYEADLEILFEPFSNIARTERPMYRSRKIRILFDVNVPANKLECSVNQSQLLSLADNCQRYFNGLIDLDNDIVRCKVNGGLLLN